MQKETSCFNSKAIIDYIIEHDINGCRELVKNLHPEIDTLRDPIKFLRDTHNWISSGVIKELYHRAARLLKDESAAYHIAKFSIENAAPGYARWMRIKAFPTGKMVLEQIQSLDEKFNRNRRFELMEVKNNQATVRLYWNSKMEVGKDICLNNQGIITYLPIIWNAKPFTLTETCCFFDGAPYCEYHLKWPRRNRLHEFFARFFNTNPFLVKSIREMEKDREIIEQKYEEVNQLNVSLNQKVKQMLAIQESGKAILSVLDFEQLLRMIMNIFYDLCRINRTIVMLVDPDEKHLEFIQGVGFTGEIPEEIRKYRISLKRLDNIMARVAHTGQSEYISHIDGSKRYHDNLILSYGQASSLFVVPLITRSKIIGVIVTDALSVNGIPAETREILEVYASQIAIAIDNARLYKRLQEQMEALKKSHVLLNRAEKLSFLGNLAARLAHEIKNPMTSISTFIQMLPKKLDDEEFRKGFYEVVKEETDRVNNLIAELLDLVKPRESNFALEDLHAQIEKMLLLISPQSKAKKIRLVRRLDSRIGKVWMDTGKIKQALLNILTNAIDFTPQGGTVELSTHMKSCENSSPMIHIEITDNGPGIPENMIDNIFDPYFSTRHKSSMHNGTGLGLFIAHQNVQDHGGSIDVTRKTGKGATFRIILPVRPSSNNKIDSRTA